MPEIPVSISSKITVFISSLCAKIDLIANITREISPPDATFASGFISSEMLVDIKNSTLSIPSDDNSLGLTDISNRKFVSVSFICFSNSSIF